MWRLPPQLCGKCGWQAGLNRKSPRRLGIPLVVGLTPLFYDLCRILSIGADNPNEGPCLSCRHINGCNTPVRCMSREEPSNRRVATLRLTELRWQREVIKRWLLDTPVPPDSRRSLEELLSSVDKELKEIQAELSVEDSGRRRNQGG